MGSRGRAIVLIMLVFVVGAAFGFALTRALTDDSLSSKRRRPATARIVKWLDKELDLSASQRQSVTLIVGKTLAEMREVRRAYRPKVSEIEERAKANIRELLTAEQTERFNRLMAELEKRRRERRARRAGKLGPK